MFRRGFAFPRPRCGPHFADFEVCSCFSACEAFLQEREELKALKGQELAQK